MAFQTANSDALLTEMEAAHALSLSSRTLQAWRIRNVGPSYVRVGRAIRYRLNDLRQWVVDQTVNPASDRCASRRLAILQ